MRAAFDDLARNHDVRLATRVEANHLFGAATRILGDATRFLRSGALCFGSVPIIGPFPDISGHVVEPVAVGWKSRHRRRRSKPSNGFSWENHPAMYWPVLPVGINSSPQTSRRLPGHRARQTPIPLPLEVLASPVCVGERIAKVTWTTGRSSGPLILLFWPFGWRHRPREQRTPLAPVPQLDRIRAVKKTTIRHDHVWKCAGKVLGIGVCLGHGHVAGGLHELLEVGVGDLGPRSIQKPSTVTRWTGASSA